jgi:maltoporin
MKNRFKLLAVTAALASAFASTAQAEGVEFHGYVRTQVGGTSEGGNLQCFGGSGIWPIRAKYRLGNECDTYGEAMVVAPFGKADGAWAKYNLMLALQEKNAADYEDVQSKNFNIASRQNFVQMGGFFPKGSLEDAKLWVGKRYYNRHDIHINDYFYWNNSGPGAGIEDIQAGPVKLAFAYHQGGGNANALTDVVSKRFSSRFYDIDVNPNGKLEGELVYLSGSTAGTASTGNGYQLFLEHTQNGLLGGFNKFALVYGKKLGAGFEWLPTYAGASPAQGDSLRFHDQLYFDLKGTKISGMATVSYGYADFGSGKNTWTSLGIRPQYNFTDNFSVAVEAGWDKGKTDSGATPKIAKLTVAPQFTLAGGFWARPAIRAFVTHAKWNAAAGDAGTNGVFAGKTSGTSYGLQVESWW